MKCRGERGLGGARGDDPPVPHVAQERERVVRQRLPDELTGVLELGRLYRGPR